MITRRNTSFRAALCAASALAMFGYAGSAQAQGVKAGTLITSTASASYTSGTTAGTVSSNTVNVRVDELIDVTVSALNNTPASAGELAVMSWSITNSGNGTESYTIDVAPTTGDFVPTIQTIAIDTNNNGIYDPGIDQVIQNGGTTPVVAADTSLRILVIASVPAGTAEGLSASVGLTATASTGSGTPGTVIPGAGDGGTNAVVGSNTAERTSEGTLTVSSSTNSADVSLLKAAVVKNKFNKADPIPGATISYKIDAVVSKGTAENVLLSDAIPANTTYIPGTLKLDGTALSDAAGDDAGEASSAGVRVNLGNVTVGTTKSVTFDVMINN